MNLPIGAFAVGPLLLSALLFKRKRTKKVSHKLLILCLLICALVGVGWEAYFAWYFRRCQPTPVREAWFQGVEYERVVIGQPRPLVMHLVRINLRAPGIELLVTPAPQAGTTDMPAVKTSAFARENGLQLAVNANYFGPFQWIAPFWYYPHPGNPVHPLGVAASRGTVYGLPGQRWVTLNFSEQNEVSFGEALNPAWNAISGLGYLVRGGKPVAPPAHPLDSVLYDRAAAGVDEKGEILMLAIVEGRQPGRSEGLTINEFSQLLSKHGFADAIQLDGGGSTTLVKRQPNARYELINTTSNFCQPWWERAVANHLGIFARPPRPL